MAYKDFVSQNFHFRSQVTKTASYTAVAGDECINGNGEITITLPLISTFQGTTNAEKAYLLKNIGTASAVTIAPNTAGGNTIGGRNAWTVLPNEQIVIRAQCVDTDWTLQSPYPQPGLKNNPFCKVVAIGTAGTAVNVFDSSGAPNNLYITGAICTSASTTANTVTILSGAATCLTITKGTLAACTAYGATSVPVPVVAKGGVFTAASAAPDAAGGIQVIIFGEEQAYGQQ